MKVIIISAVFFLSLTNGYARAAAPVTASVEVRNQNGATIRSAPLNSVVTVRITLKGAMNGTLGKAKLKLSGKQKQIRETFSDGQISASCSEVSQPFIRSIDVFEPSPRDANWVQNVGGDDNVTTVEQSRDPAYWEYHIDFDLRIYGGPTSCGLSTLNLDSLEIVNNLEGLNPPVRVVPLGKTIRVTREVTKRN